MCTNLSKCLLFISQHANRSEIGYVCISHRINNIKIVNTQNDFERPIKGVKNTQR